MTIIIIIIIIVVVVNVYLYNLAGSDAPSSGSLVNQQPDEQRRGSPLEDLRQHQSQPALAPANLRQSAELHERVMVAGTHNAGVHDNVWTPLSN